VRSRRHTSENEDHGIDLAPMLDFCVNLLIFFIITTSFIKEAGVAVFKPAATTAEADDSGNLQIGIRENGDIWMDRQHVELREARTRMERLHLERPNDTVVILADRGSKAGVVAKVMDEVRASGVKVMSIAADPDGG
jgi:biopolymer transport protein ExbD